MAKAQLGPPKALPGSASIEELPDGRLLKQFVSRHDQAAFAALVQRHGPMVLGVCRRVLRNHQDAEDAFQATFLVLARKAGGLHRPELLANWLYGVAYRTAQQARVKAARRCHHEREAATMSSAQAEPEPEGKEIREVLDEALFKLPEKYRAPLVLCYLEGKTNEEAAKLLGWPSGSMSARLARGRELLRQQLAGQEEPKQKVGAAVLASLAPSVLAPAALAGIFEPVTLPSTLADTTAQAAVGMLGNGTLAAGTVSPAVQELMKGTLRNLVTPRRPYLVVVLSFFVFIVLGTMAVATVLEGRSSRVGKPPFPVPHNSTYSGQGEPGDSPGQHQNPP